MKWTSVVEASATMTEVDMKRKRKKSWTIWSEGYNAWDGPDKFPAYVVGHGEGDTFEEALENFLKENPDIMKRRRPDGSFEWPYSKFHDNETDAIKRRR